MSEIPARPSFASALGRHLRENREAIAKKWLDRIAQHIDLDNKDVFPGDQLLDHVPLLIEALSDYVEDPSRETLREEEVTSKAMELGEFRLSQGFGAAELLREYDDARSVLYEEFTDLLGRAAGAVGERQAVLSYHRLLSGLASIERATAYRFLELSRHEVTQNEQALRGFNRAVSHELKNRIGVIQNAWAMLRDSSGLQPDARARLETMLGSGIGGLGRVVDDLIQLSRTAGPRTGATRQVQLPDAVQEVFGLFAELAAVRNVELIASERLPDTQVPAALTELCLVNLVSNGIKYSDPAKERRYVEVSGYSTGDSGELVVEVRDNGIGVPEAFRSRLFDRFSRPDSGRGRNEGTGLGLSIVRETVESLGGRAWASFDDPDETVFRIALPLEPAPTERPTGPNGGPFRAGASGARARAGR